MIKKLTVNDFKIVISFTAKAIFGLGLTMIIPIIVAITYSEWTSVVDFTIAMSFCIIFGYLVLKYVKTEKTSPNLLQAMMISAVTWLFACAFCAVPLYLSRHYLSFIDAYFEVMSGFTTTGLILVQDLDHMGNGLNMWRHLIAYIGGQGIIVMALTFLLPATGGSFKTMVSEGKDETLMPSIKNTARAIWIIALVTLAVGTIILSIVAWIDGFSFDRGFLHGMWMFISSWSTCGFAPQAQNAIFYHSFAFETVCMIFMILGSFNFALHYTVWRGNVKELFRNIEILSFTFTVSITTAMVAFGLFKSNIYHDIMSVIRRGLFNVVSAHTGTGQATVYSAQFANSYGFRDIAVIGIIIATAVGGCMTSTAGGFKNMRIGILFKALIHEIKKLIAPESAVLTLKYHHIKDQTMETATLKQVFFIFTCFTLMYFLAAFTGMMLGYDAKLATFEATSAVATCGLSVGITTPSMPMLLKIVYIISMWVGRMEFLSIFALFGALTVWIGSFFKRRAA
jgi:trk system potassium uptake protein TrkH